MFFETVFRKVRSLLHFVAIDVGVADLEADGEVQPVGRLPARPRRQVHGRGTQPLGLNYDKV